MSTKKRPPRLTTLPPKKALQFEEWKDLVKHGFLAVDLEHTYKCQKEDIEFLKPLGQGRYGMVWHAQHKYLDAPFKDFALKKVADGSDEDKIKKIRTEIYAMDACNHPNIIKFLGFYSFEGEVWLYMELMSCNMRQLYERQRGKHFPEPVIRKISFDLWEAMEYLHAKQIMHRDIKPENMLVSQNGVLKLGDFGIAKDIRNSKPMTGIADVKYQAPERIVGGKYDERNDIWAYGVSVLEVALLKYPILASEVELEILTRIIYLSEGDHARELCNKLCVCGYSPSLSSFLTLSIAEIDKRATFEDSKISLHEFLDGGKREMASLEEYIKEFMSV